MKVKNPTFEGAILTGDVTAPTQSPDDNSTKVATTAYADAGGGGITEDDAIVTSIALG